MKQFFDEVLLLAAVGLVLLLAVLDFVFNGL
jgi:hypothetical protein